MELIEENNVKVIRGENNEIRDGDELRFAEKFGNFCRGDCVEILTYPREHVYADELVIEPSQAIIVFKGKESKMYAEQLFELIENGVLTKVP